MNFALLVGLLLCQSTWTVDDDSPGADFGDLPAAVAAAADGDVLLVRPGSYSHFHLTGKGLSIVGEGSVRVDKPGAAGQVTEISNVPAASPVLLEGLEFPGPPDCDETRIRIAGSTTRATLIDVAAVGHLNICSTSTSALSVSSAEVMLVRTNLTGGHGHVPFPSSGGPGGAALTTTLGARVYVVQSTLKGGGGSGSDGGPALAASSESRLWIAASRVTGGTGTDSLSGAMGVGGEGILASDSAYVRVSGGPGAIVSGGTGVLLGGPGIVASSGARVVVHAVDVWTGGSEHGEPGFLQSVGFAAAVRLPSLALERTAGALGEATLTLSNGPASAPFVVLLETSPRVPRFLPAARIVGEFALVPDWGHPLVSGILSPAGDFRAPVPVSALLGGSYRPLRLQAAVGHPAGSLWLSNPTEFVPKPGGARAKRAP